MASNKATFNWEDPFLLDQQLTDVERMVRDTARAYCQMSGVRLTHAAQVPAPIPVRPGACYFALDAHGQLYERMLKAQSVMIYTPESYRDLKIEMIAVTP